MTPLVSVPYPTTLTKSAEAFGAVKSISLTASET